MSLVIDAALTLTWYFEDEATPATDELLDTVARNGAVVPPLWRLEVANGFQSSIRRKRIDVAYRDASLADLGQLPIVIDGDTDAHIWTTALWLSDRYRLTIYDACYLELAQRRNLPLATLDQELRDAGQVLGLPLFGS
ncbi:MAG TPA: type II toxin-antitoxin system VapC family toxin [Methylocella sp.]|nr:type II toxin-antitoxin system VapC family toxin [Methylocella sp.]